MSPESIRTSQPAETTEPNTDARYQIGEVADRTGVTQRTLRFYEEKGLLTPADRMEGGFRLYSEADVERIRLIKQLQQLLGFSLAEIKEMVEAEETRASLRAQRERAAGAKEDPAVVKPRAEQTLRALRTQLNVVEPKLRQLTELRADLVERIERVERRIAELERELAGEPVATP
jgi:MerR family transcriptional regulator, repressor of the yfmOP operon